MNPENPPVTPAEIIDLILEEMRAEVLEMRYCNVVRSVYHVYLNSRELRRLGPVMQRTKVEATRALNEELAGLNKRKLRLPGFAVNHKRYETIGDGWVIEFHENTDDDAAENPLIVQSEFAVLETPASDTDDRVGTDTVRITRRQISGLTTTTTETVRSPNLMNRKPSGIVYATIQYEDDRGSQSYEMTKDRIKIGRGATDCWVDLRLHSKQDISREHIQLRIDSDTGKFFIKDLSTYGTTVDGRRIPSSIERASGEEQDKNIEVPLPAKAKIGLAGVLELQFRAAKR
ncbi:MAG: Forkhead-associated protein [Bryobacterales bacterium]|nr:Forkhead-associated protein [Bryobacterales bacterium]